MSSRLASIAAVAPKSTARSARAATRSLITMWRAPKNRHHSATEIPTGPAPTISAVSPGSRRALRTAFRPTASGSTKAPSAKLTAVGQPERGRGADPGYSA